MTQLGEDNSATVTLTSAPQGAEVRLGIETLCHTPCEVRLPFGKHVLHFATGTRTVDREIRVLEDAVLHVALAD